MFTAAAAMRRVVVTEKDVLKPFAVLMTLNFVILLSWTIVDPMVFERVYTDELTSYGRCMPQGNQWKGFIATLAILNFVALVIVNVQAYQARSIEDELAESKYIGLATLSMFQIFIVGVPLLVIVYNDPSGKKTAAWLSSLSSHFCERLTFSLPFVAYFFVWCGIIFIVCSTILLLIFVPKILKWKSKGSDRSSVVSRFSTKTKSKWSQAQAQGSHASHSHASPQSQQEGELAAMNRVPRPVSEVETKHVKQVAFAGEESELIHRRDVLLDKVKDLVLEKHNIDITSIILKIRRAEEVAVTDQDDAQAQPESTVVESA